MKVRFPLLIFLNYYKITQLSQVHINLTQRPQRRIELTFTRLRDSVVASPQSDRPTSYRPENAENATHFRYLSILYQ